MSNDETKMIEEFIEDKNTHEEELTLEFARAILDCELRKKEITIDVKEIKQEAKDNGIQVQTVMKAVKMIKEDLKNDFVEKKNNEEMFNILKGDSDIRFKIESLLAK